MAEGWNDDCEYRPTAAAVVDHLALMLAHDCLLYDETPRVMGTL